jgi:hypothetical protein
VNTLRARLYCVFQLRQARASMYIYTHIVTVKAGNLAGTDGTPQVPPKLCSGRLRG